MKLRIGADSSLTQIPGAVNLRLFSQSSTVLIESSTGIFKHGSGKESQRHVERHIEIPARQHAFSTKGYGGCEGRKRR